MIFILVCIAIVVAASIINYMNSDMPNRLKDTFICAFVVSIMLGIVIGIVSGTSYKTYLNLKQYRVGIEQYRNAIDLYTTKAKLSTSDRNIITDLKYNKYQDALGTLVQDYKRIVTTYNNILIGKRALKDNIVFNWLVVGPDPDMKVVEIEVH